MYEPTNDNQRGSVVGLDSQHHTSPASNELASMLRQQIRRWPLVTLGAAIVAGYLLGRREATSADGGDARMRMSDRVRPANAHSGRGLSRGSAGERQAGDGMPEHQGRQRSEAPNASFASGASSGATGFDSPAVASSYLSNTDVGGPGQGRPYYPPGGAPDSERSGQEQGEERS